VKYSTLQLREKAIQAYSNNQSIASISKTYCVHRSTVHRWIEKNSREKSLKRRQSPGSGRPAKLSDKQIKRLTDLILKPASSYGFETDFWTIKRIISLAKRYLKIKISKTTMYEILYNEEYSYKKPEKRYYEANQDEQKEWIKKVIPKIKKCVKKHRGILYFEDESNVSLNAVLGKTWGPIGVKSIQKTTGNKASISAMSAISNSGRLIFTLHEIKITSIQVINFLDQMLKQHPKRHIIVVMDKAPPHTSKITKRYIESKKRLHVFYLPARSPELNPDEKVWNHLKNEELKSHQARNKKELKNIAKNKLLKMSKKPSLLRGIFMRCEISEFFS
jgi:transposase